MGGANLIDKKTGLFWEVDSVVGKRITKKGGKEQYRIRWKGCGPEHDTWEPEANLCDSALEAALAYKGDVVDMSAAVATPKKKPKKAAASATKKQEEKKDDGKATTTTAKKDETEKK